MPRMILVIISLVVLSLSLIPFQYLFLKLNLFWQKSLPHAFHRMVAWLMGFRIKTIGTMGENRPLLLVSNHISWSDIIILSAVGKVSFIAKAEVRDWPIFGMLAVLQRTIFVERERRGKTGEQTSQIANRMVKGDAMVLFAEGTTSNGNRILPFKTALFGAAHAALRETDLEKVWVQPVSIAYTGLHGMPMGRYFRPLVSWPGDVQLMPHLKGVIREGAIDVEVRFGEPIEIDAKTDRKQLARIVEERVRIMHQSSLSGRELTCDDTQFNETAEKH